MSLRDALFQDAMPMDVYIVADWPDGVSGSGTEQDPYLAATQTTATYSTTSISIGASYIPGTYPKTVTIQTSSTVPFQVGDLVIIDGTNLFFLNYGLPMDQVSWKPITAMKIRGAGMALSINSRPAYTHQSPLLQIESTQLYYCNNQASDGTVISGTDRDASNMFLGGLNNRVDEAFMLAYL